MGWTFIKYKEWLYN